MLSLYLYLSPQGLVELLYSPAHDTFTLLPPIRLDRPTPPRIPNLSLSALPSVVQQRIAALDMLPMDVAIPSVGLRHLYGEAPRVLYYVVCEGAE